MNRRSGPPQPAPSEDLSKIVNSNVSRTLAAEASTPTAYERILDKLHDLDLRVRTGYRDSVAQCPSHDDRSPSLGIWDKDGKAKIVCFAGCDDALDVLPALDMTVADLYDEKRSARGAPDPERNARSDARRSMNLVQKWLDNLLHLPDVGERFCMGIARMRPEFYIWEREQFGSDASDASHASDQKTGGGTDE